MESRRRNLQMAGC